MDTSLSQATLPDEQAADQGRQVVGGRANRNAFVSFWRQRVAAGSGRARHVTGSLQVQVDARQLGHDSEAALGRNEVSKVSLPRKLRALVLSTTSRKSGRLHGESGHPSPITLPAHDDTAPLHVELSIPPPPEAAAESPVSDVDHASASSVPSSHSGADQEPAPAVAAVSPESSPSIHPTFAVFLEEAALAESARVRRERNNAARGGASPRRRRSTTSSSASSRASARAQPDCGHPACILAAQRIRDIHHLQRAYFEANVLMDHRCARDAYRALTAAYRVQLDCEARRAAALLGELAERMPVGSPEREALLATIATIVRFGGRDPSTVLIPALGEAGMGQRVYGAGRDGGTVPVGRDML